MSPLLIATALRRSLESMEHHEKLTLGGLILGALLIRLMIMFLLRTYQFPTEKSMGAEMGWIARNLADGQGFRVGNGFGA